MSILRTIEIFVKDAFKTTIEVFIEALKLSPNAQGYVRGSVTELLLKRHLESLGYTVDRIREKWEGKKHSNHHGDLYFMHKDSELWYVLESKGLKSNSEKWHKLYNVNKLTKFMFSHSDKIDWIKKNEDIDTQIKAWISENLPKFFNEYQSPMYNYEEIQNYLENMPTKETEKSRSIDLLKDLTREEVNCLIEERLDYLMSKMKVLETHFVSGISASNKRTQATPRKNEFNLISVDMSLRYSEHKFLFANPGHLDSSTDDVDHLQQNYIIGFVFSEGARECLSLSDEWFDSFEDVYATLAETNAVNKDDMQIDNRNIIYSE